MKVFVGVAWARTILILMLVLLAMWIVLVNHYDTAQSILGWSLVVATGIALIGLYIVRCVLLPTGTRSSVIEITNCVASIIAHILVKWWLLPNYLDWILTIALIVSLGYPIYVSTKISVEIGLLNSTK
jgi:hypothetical protein